MTSKPIILFVINSLAGGGAERVLTTILNASGRWTARYDLHLALLDQEPAAYHPLAHVTMHQLDARHRLGPSIVQLRRLVRRLRPAATLSFLTRANVANAVAMFGSGRPWLISERVNTSAHLGHGRAAAVAHAMVRLAYPRATHVIAVSEGVVEDLTRNFGVTRSRITAIANPVDHDRITALAAEPPEVAVTADDVVAAGRLVPAKNFAMLLTAFAASGVSGRLVLMGEGPERAALEALAQQLGIAERVLMPGFVANPFAVLSRARLFAMSSNAEGFPNGLVEAMACGLPVIATNCASGPSEILARTSREAVAGTCQVEAGTLVPAGDVDAFAAALRGVYDSPGRAAMGRAALARSLDYGVERATIEYWRRIEAVLPTPADARVSAATLIPQSETM
ncbi:glycosyltransferase [Sphingomonas sp. BT-65]|uniref:glycosyltransferase n=1 Tax=Sphingomonas sp. BT-65 TaxID=2989821 RepID=UPI00223670A9|nr:glycosyltransferase [Sphingomonas sp. BT-65]MCW4461918.1 glycosyltransferase [Sphingomonas sp. BT-65]